METLKTMNWYSDIWLSKISRSQRTKFFSLQLSSYRKDISTSTESLQWFLNILIYSRINTGNNWLRNTIEEHIAQSNKMKYKSLYKSIQ